MFGPTATRALTVSKHCVRFTSQPSARKRSKLAVVAAPAALAFLCDAAPLARATFSVECVSEDGQLYALSGDIFRRIRHLTHVLNDDVDTRHYLAELDWQGPDDVWLVYGQVNALQQNTGGWQDAVKAVVGMEWAWDKHTVFSLQLIRDVTTMNDAPHATLVQMQLRYRF